MNGVLLAVAVFVGGAGVLFSLFAGCTAPGVALVSMGWGCGALSVSIGAGDGSSKSGLSCRVLSVAVITSTSGMVDATGSSVAKGEGAGSGDGAAGGHGWLGAAVHKSGSNSVTSALLVNVLGSPAYAPSSSAIMSAVFPLACVFIGCACALCVL